MTILSDLQRKSALIKAYLENKKQFPKAAGGQIPALGHITVAGFRKWLQGTTENPDTIAQADNALRKELQINGALHPLSSEISVMKLGAMLGFSRMESRRIIDTLAGELFPTFSIFSMEMGRGEKVVEGYRGLYVVYRAECSDLAMSQTGHETPIMCMTLAVRYALPGNKVLARRLSRMRCKLNIPSYRLSIPIHDCDGYLTPANASGIHYWMFETRGDQATKQMVMLVTGEFERGPVDEPDRQVAHGVMISQDQQRQPQPTIWPIVIERVEGPAALDASTDDGDELDAEQRFTREYARLTTPENVPPWVPKALRDARKFAPISAL